MTKRKKHPTIKDMTTLLFFGSNLLVTPDCSKSISLKGVPNLNTNTFDVERYIYTIESKVTSRLFEGSRNIKWDYFKNNRMLE